MNPLVRSGFTFAASLGLGLSCQGASAAQEADQRPPRPTLGFVELAEPTNLEAGKTVVAPAPIARAVIADVPDSTCSAGCFDWTSVPPVRVFPRPGFFGIPPKGPGYYSLLDHIHGECRPGQPKYGYPPQALVTQPFFDADFRYLDDPKTPPQDFLEKMHRVHLGDNWLFSTGGEVRWRHVMEVNSRLSGKNNEYDLLRTRVFGDLWYKDRFRVYIEFLDAHSFNQELLPLGPDVDRSDLLNAFIELKVWDDCNGKAYVRGGRQELLFGSQRLISPPDWLNTRRTFNGVRGYYTSKEWDVDLFWAQPVIPHPSHFDSIDNNQNFAGAWVTHRPDKGQFRDFYYLFLDNTNKTNQLGIDRAPFNIHTLGTRWAGDKNNWLYDFEGMIQLGERGQSSILAGSATAGLGYHFACAPMTPVVWLYYDYASGDQNPNAGDYNTFNQLFAFGPYYMGWLDLVGRQNIHDLNAHLYLYPTKWITVNLQYHHFELASAKDALYNAGGVATRRDATGAAGRQVGNELDLIVNFHLSKHSDILAGYSYLWAGDFLQQTGPSQDPSLFYVMYNFRW